MSIRLCGANSEVVINAIRLVQAIRKETGVLLKVSDKDYSRKVDQMMHLINDTQTLELYEQLFGRPVSKRRFNEMYSGPQARKQE